MTNAEKYREEIENYDEKKICNDFIIPKILKKERCLGMIACDHCRMLQMLWLMEEYKEPETDWSKVAVDTPILVRDYETESWLERHFTKFESGHVYAWSDGQTSWTAKENAMMWKYAKLAEEGDK